MAFSYSVTEKNNKSVITLTGEADMSRVDEMKAIMEKALALSPHIIIDASQTEMINSTCFGVINSYRQKTKQNGGEIVFAALNNDRVKKVFDVMGWNKIVKVFATVEEAVNA